MRLHAKAASSPQRHSLHHGHSLHPHPPWPIDRHLINSSSSPALHVSGCLLHHQAAPPSSSRTAAQPMNTCFSIYFLPLSLDLLLPLTATPTTDDACSCCLRRRLLLLHLRPLRCPRRWQTPILPPSAGCKCYSRLHRQWKHWLWIPALTPPLLSPCGCGQLRLHRTPAPVDALSLSLSATDNHSGTDGKRLILLLVIPLAPPLWVLGPTTLLRHLRSLPPRPAQTHRSLDCASSITSSTGVSSTAAASQ